jgi:hypothetical protein
VQGDPDEFRVGSLRTPFPDDGEFALGLVEDVADLGQGAHAVTAEVGQDLLLDQPAPPELVRPQQPVVDQNLDAVVDEAGDARVEPRERQEVVGDEDGQERGGTDRQRLVLAIAVRPMIAPRATAAATSIAVHCDSVRRGATRSPTSATAYIPEAFAAAIASSAHPWNNHAGIPTSIGPRAERRSAPRGPFMQCAGCRVAHRWAWSVR